VALVDIDRHLLTEMVYNIDHIKKATEKIFQAFDDISDAGSRSDTVLFNGKNDWVNEIKKIRKSFILTPLLILPFPVLYQYQLPL